MKAVRSDIVLHGHQVSYLRAGRGSASGTPRASADLEEVWHSFVSLAEPEARRAFLHTLRGIIDLGGQRVTAHDRLYLAETTRPVRLAGQRRRARLRAGPTSVAPA